MHKITFMLACLAGTSHGLRVPNTIEQLQTFSDEVESPRTLAMLLVAFNPAPASFTTVSNDWVQPNPTTIALSVRKGFPLMSDEFMQPAPMHRRGAILSGAAAALLTAGSAYATEFLGVKLPDPKKAGYITMGTYEKRFMEDVKDKETFVWFEQVSILGTKQKELEELAGKKLKDVGGQAFDLEKKYRQEAMDKAVDRLSGEKQEKGKEISKALFNAFEKMNRESQKPTGKAKTLEAIKEMGQLCRDFCKLAPKKFERFGTLVTETGETLGEKATELEDL